MTAGVLGLLLVLVAIVGSYTFLPALMSNLFEQSIANDMGLDDRPEVTLSSQPPASILSGTFADGSVSLRGGEFGGVRPKKVLIDLDPFDLNMLKSVSGGVLTSDEPLSGKLRMKVSEDEISRIASSAEKDISVSGIELEKDRIKVRTRVQLLGVDVPVAVTGGLRVGGRKLKFVPRRVSAFGVQLPDRLSDELLSQADFAYPLQDLPYKAEVSEVKIEKDYLILSGRLESITLGAGNG